MIFALEGIPHVEDVCQKKDMFVPYAFCIISVADPKYFEWIYDMIWYDWLKDQTIKGQLGVPLAVYPWYL